MMDLNSFIGKNVDNIKLELEKNGYKVVIVNNSLKKSENSQSLIVRAKIIEENVIELITGDFIFLS